MSGVHWRAESAGKVRTVSTHACACHQYPELHQRFSNHVAESSGMLIRFCNIFLRKLWKPNVDREELLSVCSGRGRPYYLKTSPAGLIFFAIVAFSDAQFNNDLVSSGYARSAAEYLRVSVYAKAAALGSAVTAWQEGLAGMQYNPAIVDRADSMHLWGAYALLSLDRKHQSVAFAGPAGEYAALGLALTNYSIENIDGRNKDGEATGLFNSRETNVALSVAGRLPGELSIGLSARYLSQHLESEGANGISFDMGALWSPFSLMRLGGSITNAGRLWWKTGSVFNVLPCGRLGIATLLLENALIAEIDITKTLYQPIEIAGGIEYTILDVISLRSGGVSAIKYRDMSYRKPDMTFGVGFHYARIRADYALGIPGSQLGLAHRITVGAGIPLPL